MSSRMAAGALACLGLLSVPGTGWAQTAPVEVTIRKLTFRPQTLSVRVGSTMTFRNADDMTHSIVASDGSFRTNDIPPGGSAAVTLKKPGSFAYFCSAHPFMEGRVVVTGKATEATGQTGSATNDR